MKHLKKFLTLFIAAFLCLGIFAFAACEGDDSTPETVTAYEFTVRNADDTPAAGVFVQLCQIVNAETGELGACYDPVATDANGKVVYNPNNFPGESIYEIHLLDASYAPLSFTGEKKTPATYAKITLTLNAN